MINYWGGLGTVYLGQSLPFRDAIGITYRDYRVLSRLRDPIGATGSNQTNGVPNQTTESLSGGLGRPAGDSVVSV